MFVVEKIRVNRCGRFHELTVQFSKEKKGAQYKALKKLFYDKPMLILKTRKFYTDNAPVPNKYGHCYYVDTADFTSFDSR